VNETIAIAGLYLVFDFKFTHHRNELDVCNRSTQYLSVVSTKSRVDNGRIKESK
jgi:hypothetical protein